MIKRRGVDVEDFASECERGNDKDEPESDVEEFASDCERGNDEDEPEFANPPSSEIGWRVSLDVWRDSWSRTDVMQIIRSIIRDYRASSHYSVVAEDEDVLVAIFHRAWSLLLQVPQQLLHVRISYRYRHSYLPSWGLHQYVFIRTSQGKDYQFYHRHEVEMLQPTS